MMRDNILHRVYSYFVPHSIKMIASEEYVYIFGIVLYQ